VILMKRIITFISFTILVLLSNDVSGHEIVGEVTPLMIRMERMLKLIGNGLGNEAMILARNTYNDFHDPGSVNEEQGLKHNGLRIDKRFGTDVASTISISLEQRDPVRLQTGLRSLSFLLMLEKFDVLESTFKKTDFSTSAQRTIFWLGRNYFSYLLEPTLAKEDPVEEKRLDRLLDKMLYRVEDREWEEFRSYRIELVNGINEYFNLEKVEGIKR